MREAREKDGKSRREARDFILRLTLAAITVATPLTVAGQGGRSTPVTPPRDTTWVSTRADARARTTADSLRSAILALSTFAGFADAPCAPGDVRTFERDTTGASSRALNQLEMLVLSYGANVSLNNANGKNLIRAIVRLEGGGPAPRWDTMTGEGPRAFNPILPVALYNAETKQCQMTPGVTPDGIVLPTVTEFVAPRDSGALNFSVAYGAKGINDLRNTFFAGHGNDPSAVMRTTRVNAHALWGDYAIVSVVREQELKGVVPIGREKTGAVYAFHRSGAEWRVLALVRNW